MSENCSIFNDEAATLTAVDYIQNQEVEKEAEN